MQLCVKCSVRHERFLLRQRDESSESSVSSDRQDGDVGGGGCRNCCVILPDEGRPRCDGFRPSDRRRRRRRRRRGHGRRVELGIGQSRFGLVLRRGVGARAAERSDCKGEEKTEVVVTVTESPKQRSVRKLPDRVERHFALFCRSDLFLIVVHFKFVVAESCKKKGFERFESKCD